MDAVEGDGLGAGSGGGGQLHVAGPVIEIRIVPGVTEGGFEAQGTSIEAPVVGC